MRIVLILLALACGLQACGLKGPLVLPPPAAKSTPPQAAATPTAPAPSPSQQEK